MIRTPSLSSGYGARVVAGRGGGLLALFVVFALWAPWRAEAKDWPSKLASAAERGEELYLRHCQACHGERAAGDGPMASALVADVPDLSTWPEGVKIADRVGLVMKGRGAMPGYARAFEDLYPWGGDFDDAARDVLRHMKKLAGLPVEEDDPGEVTLAERDEEQEAAQD